MSRKFLTALDLGKNELQNAAVQSLGAAPSAPAKFQLYGNSGDNTLYWWDGTAWASARGGGTGFPGFGNVTPETTFGQAVNNGVGTTAARNDHTHGTPTHDNAAHSAINLSALAPPLTAINMNGQLLSFLAPPVSASDATTKSYVDNISAGLTWKTPVRIASTANLGLTGLTAIDGVTPVANDRILAKNQTTASQNGIYVAASGAWTRATDADSGTEIVNAAVFVSEGTANADTAWVQTTNAPITVGTTALTWVQFAGGGAVTAGAGLTQSGNVLDVGAGTGITVAADSVALNTTYTDGRYVNTTGDIMDGDLGMDAGVGSVTPKVNFQGIVGVAGSIWGDSGAGALRIQTQTAWGQYIHLEPTVATVMKVGAATVLTVGASVITAAQPVALPADPASNLHAATKQYVDTKVPATRTLTAGNGLTGGGDLSANRTLDVGAGTGITVAADAVALDTAYTDARYVQFPFQAKRYATDVGGATSQVITHNLVTLDCIVQVYRKASPFDVIECDIEHTSTNSVTLRFTTAPATAEYRVVVLA
jgi:hypothetical protein